MLPLGLFRRRNFAIGNIETFSMYGGLGVLFFLLVLFLQQIAGYTALEAGLTSVPVTIVMFALSTRFGMLADRYGPRFFMGVGPLVAAVGLALFLPLDADVDYVTDLLPGLLVFALGLSMTVAPLTATVLADADENNAGIASGTNNAIARVASLVAIAAVGALVADGYGAKLESELGPQAAARPAVQAAVEEAKKQPLARVVVPGLPGGLQAEVTDAGEAASVARLPDGYRDCHRPGGPRRRAGACGHRQPAPPRGCRGLSRRSAGGGHGGGGAPVAVRLAARSGGGNG